MTAGVLARLLLEVAVKRLNKQWRICFEWPKSADGPEHVEIIDYH